LSGREQWRERTEGEKAGDVASGGGSATEERDREPAHRMPSTET
jgi:hypothetical protein